MGRKKTTTDLESCKAHQLVKLANRGSSEALEVLRKRYEDRPELPRIHGDLAWSARESRMKQFLGDKAQGSILSIREKMQDMINRVAGDSPTQLERLLAERVAMCWLDVQDHEHRYSSLGTDTFAKYEWCSRMLDRAHNRYLSAIKVLAQVRRLSVPLIQLNVADKQINMLSGTDMGKEGIDVEGASGDGA